MILQQWKFTRSTLTWSFTAEKKRQSHALLLLWWCCGVSYLKFNQGRTNPVYSIIPHVNEWVGMQIRGSMAGHYSQWYDFQLFLITT